MRSRHFAAVAAMLLGSAVAQAQPVKVDYTVSGSAGNWMYSFTLSNNMVGAPLDMGLYFFGVNLDGGTMTGEPAPWTQYAVPYAGAPSGTEYDLAWKRMDKVGVMPGQSLGGFTAVSYGLTAPTSIDWVIWGYSASGAKYTGGGNFNGASNTPGFEGSSNVTVPEVKPSEELFAAASVQEDLSTTVPEPSTYALMAAGLAALGMIRSRRRRAA